MIYLEKLGKLKEIKRLDSGSSEGNLEKWSALLCNGVRVYIKTSSKERGRYNYECEAECVACRLACMLGIQNVVMYELDVLHWGSHQHTVCVSRDFIGNNSFSTLNSIIPNVSAYSGVNKFRLVSSYLPQSIVYQIQTILLFDAIILNSDRHLRNIGVLSTGIVPLFDNGNSMFFHENQKSIGYLLRTNLDYQPCKPFGNTFSSQLQFFSNVHLRPVNKVEVYRLVNKYFGVSRAKLINRLLVSRLERYGLLYEQR